MLAKLLNNKELYNIEKLNEQPDKYFKDYYPEHNLWVSKTLKKIKDKSRVAFGVFDKDNCVATCAIKFFDNPKKVELKNFIVSSEIQDIKVTEEVKDLLLGKVLLYCEQFNFDILQIELPGQEKSDIAYFHMKDFKLASIVNSRYIINDYLYVFQKSLDKYYTGDPFDANQIFKWIIINKFPLDVNIQDNFKSRLILNTFKYFHINSKNEENLIPINLDVFLNFIKLDEKKFNPDDKEFQKILSINSIKLFFDFMNIECLKNFCKNNEIEYISRERILDSLGSIWKRTTFPFFDRDNIEGIILSIDSILLNKIKKYNNSFILVLNKEMGSYILEDENILLFNTNKNEINAYCQINKVITDTSIDTFIEKINQQKEKDRIIELDKYFIEQERIHSNSIIKKYVAFICYDLTILGEDENHKVFNFSKVLEKLDQIQAAYYKEYYEKTNTYLNYINKDIRDLITLEKNIKIF